MIQDHKAILHPLQQEQEQGKRTAIQQELPVFGKKTYHQAMNVKRKNG
jgi:hypothetical protein